MVVHQLMTDDDLLRFEIELADDFRFPRFPKEIGLALKQSVVPANQKKHNVMLFSEWPRRSISCYRTAALHNPTDSERVDFRENIHGPVEFAIRLPKPTTPLP